MRMSTRQGLAACAIFGIGLATAGILRAIDYLAPQTLAGDALAVMGAAVTILAAVGTVVEVMRLEVTKAKIDGARTVATVVVRTTNDRASAITSTENG